ncbi:hypothetical protein MNBD_ALPHA02-2357 [hydrothermal vent metagenome]|uniref:Uridine kinase n=1 Tax=hydrothermal vent metagenome TaxID=652676 RepID=A0A3B0S1K8_9ZZZZ
MDEIDTILTEIERRIKKKPITVGINGLDCSGKTTCAQALYEKLVSRNINSRLLHIDDYNNRDVQDRVYTAHKEGVFTDELADIYYQNSIHYKVVAEAISASRQQYDVTLIEGVFLFKDDLVQSMDIKIFLSIEPSLARARYEKRKLSIADARPASVFDDIWLPAFNRYCREVKPESRSDFMHHQG